MTDREKLVEEMLDAAAFRDIGGTRSYLSTCMSAALAVAEADFARRDEWQPMETAPMDGTPLLLFARSVQATASGILVGWYLPGEGRWIECCFSHPTGIVPSYWQPLPSFPESAAIRARDTP